MFTDQVEIHIKSGKGGDGMMHFRREKFIPLGGPDEAMVAKAVTLSLRSNPRSIRSRLFITIKNSRQRKVSKVGPRKGQGATARI